MQMSALAIAYKARLKIERYMRQRYKCRGSSYRYSSRYKYLLGHGWMVGKLLQRQM